MRGLAVSLALLLSGCGYHFSGAPGDTPFPPDIKTIVVRSAVNNTTMTGIETELTNDLRREFAVGTRLKPVRSDGDVDLRTVISTYEDMPVSYRADGKELSRMGVLKVVCGVNRAGKNETLWKREFSSSHTYIVTDSTEGTLSNRREAISQMIKDLTVRIHSAMYDNF